MGNEDSKGQYPDEIVRLLDTGRFSGRLNDPSGSSYIKGPCGDSMEFYLVIENGKITDIKYHTDGCLPTKACGAMSASMAYGKTVGEAMAVSAGKVAERLKGLPDENLHCSILAVSALYRALADYLLKA